jgi:Domain of unknown function (DUF4270)
MRRKYQLATLLSLLTLFSIYATSCKNTTSDIGSSFFQSHSSIINVDSITVNAQTVYLDSVPTSGTGVVLVGNYNDSITGKINLTSYFVIGSPATKNVIDQQLVFDSLCLILKPNKYYIGDTSQPLNLAVHTLSDQVQFAPNNSAFYNTTSLPYNPVPIATWSGTIMPTLTDSIAIRLPDQFGNTLLNDLETNSVNLSNDNLFINNILYGFAITSSNSSNVVFGFAAKDSSVFMRLYYHNSQDLQTPLYDDFQITQTNLQFNHADADRTGTMFSSLNSNNKTIDSRLTNNESVCQPLANLAIGLNIPYLSNLQFLGTYTKILGAQLILKPVKGTYSYSSQLPPAMTICEVTNFYTVIDSLLNNSGQIQHGALVQDLAFGNSYYTYDLTSYLTAQLGVTNDALKTSILLIPPHPAYNTSLQKLVITNQSASSNPMQANVQLVLYTIQ